MTESPLGDALKRREESRKLVWSMRWEVIRSVLFSIALALLGNLIGWGWQRREWDVFAPALLAGLAVLAAFWITYFRRG